MSHVLFFSIGNRRLHRLVVACIFLAPQWPLAASVQPLSMPEALRIAAEQSPQQAAAAAAVRAAGESARAAGELPDPVLKVGLDNLPIEGADRLSVARDFMTMRRIGVMQEVPRAAKRRLRQERFEADAVREQLAGVTALTTLQRDAALLWLDRHFAERQADAVREQIAEAKLAIAAAEAAYRSNRGMRPDIPAAQSALGQLEDRLAQIERQRQTAMIQLARWIGDAAERPLAAPPDYAQAPAHLAHLDESVERHPELAALEQQGVIAAIDVRLAETAKKPDWSWELTFQQRGSSYANMVSFGVSIPLPIAPVNRQDREVAAKIALQEQVNAQRDDMRRAHVAEARGMLAEWESLRTRLARYDATLLPLAHERASATVDAYRAAAATLVQVLDARRAEIDVRIARLDLERDFARAWAQLTYLLPATTASATLTGEMP